jgi:hypothetical protein
VVLDLSDNNCPYKMVEAVFSDMCGRAGVSGYRIDPKVAGVSL